MARAKKTPAEVPAAESEGFDVPPTSASTPPPVAPPPQIEAEEDDDADEASQPVAVQAIETPEQRRLMREKRIAKAEEEQLRRLTRQYPVIARLVLENQRLRKRLEQKH